MKMTEVSLLGEVFTHIDDATGVQTSFAIGPLYKACVAGEPGIEKVTIPVEAEHAMFCVQRRGVEDDRIAALMGNVEWLKKPIVFAERPDGTHLLLDGTHRYVCFYAMQLPSIPAYIVPWAIASRYVVEDVPQMPEDVVMGASYLTAVRKLLGDTDE